ncbi:MAG: amidohydrolase family protein [Chloroflexota bacterium]
MKKIAIEEHCYTPYYLEFLQTRKKYPKVESITDKKGQKSWKWWHSAEEYMTWLPPAVVAKLCDVGKIRLKDMDEAGIDTQVLSFNTNVDYLDAEEAIKLTKKVNDLFAAAIKKNPERFVGFAAVYLRDPKAAADELERAVKQLGFKGTMILSHCNGEFLDGKKYWPFFARAAKLNAPVYIHPVRPPLERVKQYAGYRELAGPMWGFAAETGLTAMRLICSGIFDEYPNLKIILGHMGEALPFWMTRLDNRMLSRAYGSSLTNLEVKRGVDGTRLSDKLKKLPSQYIRDNFFITISGMQSNPALICALLALGADKILFAVDYPFEENKETVDFMEQAPISEGDKEKIYHLNAEKLFKL